MEDDLLKLLENWELTLASYAVSLAVVGKTCNGKSATENNILGRQTFISDLSPSEFIGREIVECIGLAKDGLHAVLMVFSISSRFTREEEAAMQSMKTLLGDRIVDYMIVVFTGEHMLEDSRKTGLPSSLSDRRKMG